MTCPQITDGLALISALGAKTLPYISVAKLTFVASPKLNNTLFNFGVV
jgi:hypothetical protein